MPVIFKNSPQIFSLVLQATIALTVGVVSLSSEDGKNGEFELIYSRNRVNQSVALKMLSGACCTTSGQTSSEEDDVRRSTHIKKCCI